jgi:hypothetical protein
MNFESKLTYNRVAGEHREGATSGIITWRN